MKRYIIMILLVFIASACSDMDFVPTDKISTESITQTSDGLLNVTNGNYSMFKDGLEFNGVQDDNNNYLRQYFQMSDFATDDIVCGQVTEDPLYLSFTFTHSPSQTNSRYFWYSSYKIISGANTVIESIESITDNLTEEQKQLLGENYFLRAFATFNLAKFYAFQYSVGDPSANLGVILRTSTSEEGSKARATVKETYDMIISDLNTAADLMNNSRGNEFASREAAWGLLSRVHLYMSNYDMTIEFADKVINSNRFSLETSQSFPSYFANTLNSQETIWCIAHTPVDNKGKGSIASMIYSDGNSGWGEEFATYAYLDLLAENENDVRGSLIDTLYNEDGDIAKKNGIEVFYIKKFSYQDGDPNLSSPVMLRLAEIYLNKAEAEAYKGMEAEALNDVNMIRKNRGLENDLITSIPVDKDVVGVVLEERRRELAFEGHRLSDIIRSHKNIKREYWGYHITGLSIGEIDLDNPPTAGSGYDNLEINYNDSKVLYYIPIDEILTNDLCVQN